MNIELVGSASYTDASGSYKKGAVYPGTPELWAKLKHERHPVTQELMFRQTNAPVDLNPGPKRAITPADAGLEDDDDGTIDTAFPQGQTAPTKPASKVVKPTVKSGPKKVGVVVSKKVGSPNGPRNQHLKDNLPKLQPKVETPEDAEEDGEVAEV